MDKEIAILSGDWHYHIWKQYNENYYRIAVSEVFINSLAFISHRQKIPILFTGDLFHTPKGLTTKLIKRAINFFSILCRDYPDFKLIGISGNHDLETINTKDSISDSLFEAICIAFPKNFICIDRISIYHNNLHIFGIPYLFHNSGFKETLEEFKNKVDLSKTNILLIHSDLPGAIDTNNREIAESVGIPRNMGEFFQPFDKVFAGHIHKPQMIWKDKVYMIGAPYQQRKSDSGCDMGYYILNKNLSVEFKETNYPRFRYYNEGEKPDNDFDYWIMIPKPKKLKEKKVNKFFSTTDRSKLAREYVSEKGIKSISKRDALIEILNKVDD